MLLSIDWATLAFQIANFLLLAVLLYHFLFRPVMKNVRQRAEEKEQLAREMARDHAESARMRAELEARLARAEEEAEAIIDRAREEAEAERAEILRETRAEVERILVEAHADASRLRQQEIEHFHAELIETIVAISSLQIGRIAPPEVHDKLVQELNDRIWEMGHSEMQRVEALRRSLGDRTPVAHVTTARPLSPEQQRLLVRTFTALADHHVNLEVKTDPSLAAGIRVRLGDMVVDNSVASQLDELRQAAAKALQERIAHA